MTLKRVWIPSPNYSQRNSSVRLIVLHTAEGATTYRSLGNFFSNSSSGVSSHVGIDDTSNEIGEYVVRGNKAWTQANANPYSVAAELCAFAGWSKEEWQRHPIMLQNTAQWIAEEAKTFQIPIKKLTATQAQDGRTKGICQHVDLGVSGGNHWDCGPNFPIDQVIQMANPPETYIGDDMIIKEPDGKVYQLIYGGDKSYWRQITNQASKIPESAIIKDDGGLLAYWKVGSGN